MDRIGRFTVMLAILLPAGLEPWTCRAQLSAPPAPSIPPPRPGSDFGTTAQKLRGASADGPLVSDPGISRPGRPARSRGARASRSPLADLFRDGVSGAEPNSLAGIDAGPGPPATAAPCPGAERIDRADVRRAATGLRSVREAQDRAVGADRPGVPDQSRHRLAAFRRSAADRGRRPGQRVGGRSSAHPGQGPLGPDIDTWRRLCSTRRRWPGLQQGHHDRPERELFLKPAAA